MGIEMVKDSQGKEHMVFDQPGLGDDNCMGNCLNDFEILQILGEGSYGFVAKVRSRLNHKIYAMKKVDFSKISTEKEKQLCLNEISIIQKMDSPYVNKYYKYFFENNNVLYIIMEFMDNGDLDGFINAHKVLNKPIEEEELWNIFYQSMSGLIFIHSKGIIHRDIKPANLFMSNEKKIKIGDFGVSALVNENKNAYMNQINPQINQQLFSSNTRVGSPVFMSPEIMKNEAYDQKVDVYSMGCSFYQMCYFQYPRMPTPMENSQGERTLRLVELPKVANKYTYSQELVNIIDLMIEMDPNKRKSSKEIFQLIEKEYMKNYIQNSSIESVFSCLYSLKDVNEYFYKNSSEIDNKRFNAPVAFTYKYGINSFFSDPSDCVSNLRKSFAYENRKFSDYKEIEPSFLLSFLFEKLHKELNLSQNIDASGISPQMMISEDQTSALLNFVNYYKAHHNSVISGKFHGIMKSTKTFSNKKIYSYNYYSFLTFDVEKMKNYSSDKKIKLLDFFWIQKSISIKLNKNEVSAIIGADYNGEIKESKTFYSMPLNLVIYFNWQNSLSKNYSIQYDLSLDLSKIVEFESSPKKYELVGIVKKDMKKNKEHYFSIVHDYNNYNWCKYNNDNHCKKIPNPIDEKEGQILMLFYRSRK